MEQQNLGDLILKPFSSMTGYIGSFIITFFLFFIQMSEPTQKGFS